MKREEAIKIVRKICQTDVEKEALEILLPELRESEDEKIRTLLVALVQWAKTFEQSGLDSNTANKMLLYLEKQKEQKPNYCHHEVDETGWTEEYRKAYYDGWNNCNMQHEQLKADQKPAEWSEEDEKHINPILRILDRQQCWDGTTGKRCNPYQDEIDWLKSLRPVSKESLQPHWKPSEEQMKALDKAIPVCIGVVGRDEVAPLESLYEQLKSIQ